MGLQKEIIILEGKKMKNGRKAIKKIIALVMVILMGITITSCQGATNYDEKIISMGKQTLSELKIVPGRTYNVKEII